MYRHVYLNEEEAAFVASKEKGYLRSLVQRAMARERPVVTAKPDPPAPSPGLPSGVQRGVVSGSCPSCGHPYSLGGTVCRNRECDLYRKEAT